MKPRRMTIPEACLDLRLSYQRVYDLALCGKLGAAFRDNHWTLDAAAVATLAREREQSNADGDE